MEGLSGAAGLITVLGVALTSTREIHRFVSGIKNAPKIVQQMTLALQDLSTVLQQFAGYTDESEHAANLETLVRRCASDLQVLEKELAKLSAKSDNRVARQWRNVKAVFKERELDRMGALISQHCAVLSLQMQLSEGFHVLQAF